METYKKGYRAYIEGRWQEAKDYLDQVNKIREDNVSKALIKFMEHYKFKAPADWKGHHLMGGGH